MTISNFENNVNGTALISNFWEYSEGGGSQIHDNSRVRLKNIWHPGEAIEGDYTIEGSRTNSLIADPAIVIPGILGSATQYIGGIGKMKLDPIFHTYDNLIASFKKNGYTENQNLFEFPYEWRKSNTITADLLKQKIQEIKNETGISKVDLVAHSMGGLVARYCIEELNCQNDVDQLVTLGTPHKGSPKDYLAWEGGELGIDLEEKFIRNLFMPEAYHAGYDTNLQKYIQEKIPSVRELLPDYNYLYDVTDSKMKNYPTGYPKNGFLEDLNSESMLSKLGNVDFTNIVGNIANKESTISKYRVVDSTISGKWEHGMPENFYDTNTNQGIEYGEGDETVPLISSTGISAGKPPVELNSTHGNLPTTAQCEVIEELTAKTDCKYVSTFERIKDVLTFGVLSPIDIQVIAPDGKWIGKNINDLDENDQISGAFYSGYDTENEFLTIPNPIDGEYKILTQGTETGGDYKIEVAKISEPDNSQEAKESVATLEGTASTGQQEEKKIEVQENQMVIPNQDSTPPTIAGSASPDANTNGWNNTDVKVHFEATDNESGVDTATPDVILTSEGANQSATGTAKDKAGNESSATVSGINIDKTAPQTDISLAGDKGNNNWFTVNVEVKFSATDNLSGIENIYYSLDGGNFTKGSSIVIGNEGEHSLKYYSKDKADNQENAKEEKIKIDKTAPVVTIKSPQSKNYLNNLTLSVDYSVNDSAVGPEKITSQAYVDGILLSGKTIDLSLQSLGAHQFNVIASDEAGNESQASKEFKILTNIDAIIANADHYYDLGMIKSLNSKLFLKVKLRIIHDFMEVLMVLQKTPLPARVKNILLENAKRIINNQIGDLINQIQKKKDLQKDINPTAQKLLIESLGYIKI
jgi:pimeloyl-ACP methyl ester carboxylesterase